MPREFKVVGKINEQTRVLGSTHGEVQQAIAAGFQQQFRLQEEARAKRAEYAQAQQALVGPPSEAVARTVVAGGFVPRAVAVAGAARTIRSLTRGLVLGTRAHEVAMTETFVAKAIKEQLEAGMRLNVMLSNGGKLVIKTTNDEPSRPMPRRRVGEKDYGR